MKKHILLILSLLIATQCYAGWWEPDCCCRDCFGFESELTFDIGAGYRHDNLKWSRYPKDTPGVKIQNSWDNVDMPLVETNAMFLACDRYFFKADFDFGWLEKTGRQSYKRYDEGTLSEWLTSDVRGTVYDLSGALGYKFNFDCARIYMVPMLGYSYEYQRFKSGKYKGELVEPSERYQFHNKFIYRWSGPWLGVAFAYHPLTNIIVYCDYEFHWAWMRAQNAINEHDLMIRDKNHLYCRNAYGNEFIVGANYLWCDFWLLGLKFNYKNFWSDKGKFHSQNKTNRSTIRKLRWESYNITLDFGFKF